MSGVWDAILLALGLALLRLVGFTTGEVLATGGVVAGGLVLLYVVDAALPGWSPGPVSHPGHRCPGGDGPRTQAPRPGRRARPRRAARVRPMRSPPGSPRRNGGAYRSRGGVVWK